MKNRKWFYFGLAALVVMLLAATALYAAPGRERNKKDDGNSRGRIRDGIGQRFAGRGQMGDRSGMRGMMGGGMRGMMGDGGGGGMRGRMGGGMGGGMFAGMLKELNLTDEQKADIKAVFENHKDALSELRTNMQDTRWDFRSATFAEDPDPDEIRAAAQKMASAQADIAIEMIGIKAEIKNLLTDEQREIVSEHKDKMLERLKDFQEGLGRRIESLEE